MADQFLGVQAFNGTPTLFGANTKASASPKQDENGEFPGVLLRAFLGGNVQASSGNPLEQTLLANGGKSDSMPGASGDQEKEKKGEANQSDPSIAAFAASVVIPLPVLVAASDNVEAPFPQVTPTAGQSEGSALLSTQVTQGETSGLELVLPLMEPVKPETVDLSPVPAQQQSGKGKLFTVDSQQESQQGVQEPRPVYKLLRDLTLGMFSSGPSESPAENPVENMMTFQTGRKMFSSEIAQSVLSSTDKIKSGAVLHSEPPVSMIMHDSTPETTGVQVPESRSTLNPSENVRIQTPAEATRAPGQEQVLTVQNEQITQQPLVEEVRVAGPASSATLPIAELPRKSGESMQESSANARTVGDDRGAKQSDATPLPKGVGVNAAASEHELNDSLAGRSQVNVLHQQGMEPRQDANFGKDVAAASNNPAPPLTPELSQSVLEQVVKGLAFQVQGNVSEMRLTLKPESLGEMAVKVRVEDGKLQAQIDVSQPAVKAIVETNLPQLRQELINSGIDVQRIDVFAATQDTTRESAGNRGDKPKHRGGRRSGTTVDEAESAQAVKMLGYNTIEVII